MIDKSLKIGIDARPFEKKRTGLGRYVFELCKELDKELPNATFYLYSQFPVDLPCHSERWIARIETRTWAKCLKNQVWFKLLCGQFCKRDNLDVFWASATYCPTLNQSVRLVTTSYDLNNIIIPRTMPFFARLSSMIFYKQDVLKADAVISISQGTADRLQYHYKLVCHAIIRPALSGIFKPKTQEEIEHCLESYSIDSPYLLAIAIWEPRKNLEVLVKTFLKMKSDGLLSRYKLVLVGRFDARRQGKFSRLVYSNLQDMLPLGYIPDKDLPMLYSGADLFVFPSIYEGFGMPVLEAIACGTKVVASDIPELHEAGGEDAIYISPNENGIRQGILKALSDKTPQSKSVLSKATTWKEGAEVLARILASNIGSCKKAHSP
jgi:glycosyltransferase involved in cell wall biosynthesis